MADLALRCREFMRWYFHLNTLPLRITLYEPKISHDDFARCRARVGAAKHKRWRPTNRRTRRSSGPNFKSRHHFQPRFAPFDNSAMDGYAVRVADVQGATKNAPVTLRLGEIIGAGDVPQSEIITGQCAKIMTGAPLPRGAEAVIMREETREVEGNVEFFGAATAGQNLRSAGSDVARGETVLMAGARVRPAELAMLAALGQSQVEVYARPRVGIVTTGEELVGVEAELQAAKFAIPTARHYAGCV